MGMCSYQHNTAYDKCDFDPVLDSNGIFMGLSGDFMELDPVENIAVDVENYGKKTTSGRWLSDKSRCSQISHHPVTARLSPVPYTFW